MAIQKGVRARLAKLILEFSWFNCFIFVNNRIYHQSQCGYADLGVIHLDCERNVKKCQSARYSILICCKSQLYWFRLMGISFPEMCTDSA